MMLYEFPSIRSLANYILCNIRSIPEDDDTFFIFPEQLLRDKIGNCIDIAFTFYEYCRLHKIPAYLGNVAIAYNENHQGHIICLYEEKRIYHVVQTDAIAINDAISDVIFNGTTDLQETLNMFSKAYLPGLKRYLIQQKHIAENIMKEYAFIFTPEQLQAILTCYKNNDTSNKQLLFSRFFKEFK